MPGQRSPNGGDDPRQQGNAEDEKDSLDHFVVETRFCHAPLLGGSRAPAFDLDHAVPATLEMVRP